jgi:prepilin-type N-terminal cleavage/methylation domain-containing protein
MRRPFSPPHKSDRCEPAAGFTLLEVMLAMGILTLGATAILGLLTFGAAVTRAAELRSSGAAASDAVLADLEEHLFPMEEDGSAGKPSQIVDRPVPGSPGIVYSATSIPILDGAITSAGQPLEYRVDVTLAWQAGGVQRGRTFTTLLLRQIPFGERMRRMFVEDEDEQHRIQTVRQP